MKEELKTVYLQDIIKENKFKFNDLFYKLKLDKRMESNILLKIIDNYIEDNIDDFINIDDGTLDDLLEIFIQSMDFFTLENIIYNYKDCSLNNKKIEKDLINYFNIILNNIHSIVPIDSRVFLNEYKTIYFDEDFIPSHDSKYSVASISGNKYLTFEDIKEILYVYKRNNIKYELINIDEEDEDNYEYIYQQTYKRLSYIDNKKYINFEFNKYEAQGIDEGENKGEKIYLENYGNVNIMVEI